LSFNASFAQGCEDDLPVTTTDGSGVPKTSSMKFFGYIQPQFEANYTDPATNEFNFKRARFGVRGRVNRSFSYYFSIEASPFLGGGSPYLLDAFATYDKHKWAKASLGSFKQPFSLELVTACHALTTIDRSIVVDQLISPQRDYGLMLLGGDKSTKITYRVALMNGSGIGIHDNNTKKDIVGRLTYQPIEYLAIGASYRYGYPSNNIDDRKTFGVEFLANYEGWALQGEYINDEGDYNLGSGGGCGSTPVELGEFRQGAYLMLSYMTKAKIQPVLKWEYFDADRSVKYLGYQEMMTYGVNYFFNDMTRLQVNYQQMLEDVQNINSDALIFQVQIKW